MRGICVRLAVLVIAAVGVYLAPVAMSAHKSGRRVAEVPKEFRTFQSCNSAGVFSAYGLVYGVENIVVGQVVGIERADYTPPGNPAFVDSLLPHTVYQFAVEQLIKGNLPVGQNVKVFDDGAIINQVDYAYSDDPHLMVGSRYILCLKTPAATDLNVAIGGSSYQTQYVDEFKIGGGEYGKIALVSGQAVPASDGVRTAPVESFLSGDQIFSIGNDVVTEAQAIARLTAAVPAATSYFEN